jgi:hypothetical protein
MIKGNELRLFNYIFRDGLVAEVRAIIGEDNLSLIDKECGIDTYRNDGDCQPIPLTEEWLLRLGFKDRTEGYRATGAVGGVWVIPSSFNGKDIALYENWAEGKVWSYYLGHYGLPITSVHQLQNLFWCLSGEELTIKP